MDQADTLRKMMGGNGLELQTHSAVIFSGIYPKSGVTTVVENLASIFVDRSISVLLIERSRSLAMNCQKEVISSRLCKLILSDSAIQDWQSYASSLGLSYDVLLVDLGSDVASSIFEAFRGIKHVLVADSRALESSKLKSMEPTYSAVVVNKVANARLSRKIAQRVSAQREERLDHIGFILEDEKVSKAHFEQDFLVNLYPGARSVACFELLAKRISSWITHLSGGPRVCPDLFEESDRMRLKSFTG